MKMDHIERLKILANYEGPSAEMDLYMKRQETITERIDAVLKDLTLEGFNDEEMAMALDEASRWAWARHRKMV